MKAFDYLVPSVSPDRPVLIAGPTASGKSALALAIAETHGGTIVNADAIQVYRNWCILTARPPADDMARAPHELYGHVQGDEPYSVGHWIRDVTALGLKDRAIYVGGTGLYFAALTDGLAEIPETSAHVRAAASARLETHGIESMLNDLDIETRARIDTQNPMRVLRAWEVQLSTGQGLAAWQDRTGPAPLPLGETTAIVLAPDRDVLNARIVTRFDAMMKGGLMEEVATNALSWNDFLPSSKAIGAGELIAVHRGEKSLAAARQSIIVQTRRYAKRQRSWFRSRMQDWKWIDPFG